MREILSRLEFYDLFGLGVFGFLAALSLWSLATGRPMPRGVLWIIFAIGILGLAIDGSIV